MSKIYCIESENGENSSIANKRHSHDKKQTSKHKEYDITEEADDYQAAKTEFKPKGNIRGEMNQLSARAYLEQSVVSVLMQGMQEVAKQRPDNPLEFLGRYLIDASKNK